MQPRESPTAGNALPDGNQLIARASSAFPTSLNCQQLASRVGTAKQSTTWILYGKQLFLKIYRRLQPEENPDVEIGRFLTEVAHFSAIPPFLGEISIGSSNGVKTTVALLQGMVENKGDGWEWFLDEVSRWLVSLPENSAPEPSPAPTWVSERKPI